MTGIVEFLTARLDEEEDAANTARTTSVAWDAVNSGYGWNIGPDITGCWDGCTVGVMGEAHAVHIVRWQPDRVLAEIAAKRAMVASAAVVAEMFATTTEWADGHNQGHILLSLLAAPYADHPDYPPGVAV